MTLSEFLFSKGYTENEVLETEIRLDCGMDIPDIIYKDICEYHRNFHIWDKSPKEFKNVSDRQY